jgi:hypothetical protein
MQVTSPLWPLRAALLPIVGRAGYRRLLSAMYDPVLLRAAHAPEPLRRALDAFCCTHDIEAVPRTSCFFHPAHKRPGLPENELPSAIALRCTLDQLPLDASLMVEEL